MTLEYVSGAWCILGALILAIMAAGIQIGRGKKGNAPLVDCFETMLLTGVFLLGINGLALMGMVREKPLALRLLMMVSYIAVFALLGMYSKYLYMLAAYRDRRRIPFREPLLNAIYILCFLSTLVWSVNLFFPTFYDVDTNTFVKGPVLALVSLLGLVICMIDWRLLFQNRGLIGKKGAFMLGMILVFPTADIIMEIFYGMMPLLFHTILFSLIVLYVMMQHYQEQALVNEMQARARDHLQIVTGRMQPHFLYNCLTTIYMLCEEDSEKAQEAIEVFTRYLRDTLDTLSSQEQVPFDWELNQIKNYVYMEKLRFGDKIDVTYRIGSRDFQLPPLSIQAFIENAVKYGSDKEKKHVNILLTTASSEQGHTIIISDDGKGFTPGQLPEDGRKHLGIATVTERIRLISHGEVEVDSKPGKGTTVRIILPDQRISVS